MFFNFLTRRPVMKKILYFLLFFVAMTPFQAFAQQWELDKAHTNFYFEVRHTYVPVRGQFMEFTGDVYFAPENLDKSKFDFTIKVDSVDTKIGKRDTHLRSPDFFDTAKYPHITFKSSKVTSGGSKSNKYIVEGILTIKDVSRNLAFEFDYLGQKVNPANPDQIVAGFEAYLKLDRLEYHVGDGKFYKMGLVGKDVEILLALELLHDK